MGLGLGLRLGLGLWLARLGRVGVGVGVAVEDRFEVSDEVWVRLVLVFSVWTFLFTFKC